MLAGTAVKRLLTSIALRTVRKQNTTRWNLKPLALATAITGSTYLFVKTQQKTQACGIIGFVSNEEVCVDYLLEGLHILQNRGYDSAGISTLHALSIEEEKKRSQPHENSTLVKKSSKRSTKCDTVNSFKRSKLNIKIDLASVNNDVLSTSASPMHPDALRNEHASKNHRLSTNSEPIQNELSVSDLLPSDFSGHYGIVTTKFASKGTTSDCIDLIKKIAPKNHLHDTIGIGHTRWATHGAKTDDNAHPHLDEKGRVALIHNGTIENSHDLQQELIKKGFTFRSQTDTEVIVQLIGMYLDNDLDIMEAVKSTLSRLEGTWGLLIIHAATPNQIIAARNGSPLVVGIGKGRMFVASEVLAFCRHTNQYISLSDGEIAIVRADGVSLDMSRVEHAPEMKVEMSPAPFPHWTIKEIMEQPEAISRTLNYGARFDAENLVKLGGLETNKELLLSIKQLVVSACGTSLFAGMYGALIFQSLKCFNCVYCVDSSEITAESFPTHDGGLLVLSQSGETKDTHRALAVANSILLPCFSIVNQVGSLIARTTNIGVYLNAGREHAVASTKAFTTQVTALALVAGWFSQNRDQVLVNSQRRHDLMVAIHRLPIYAGITMHTRTACQTIARSLEKTEHMFILGKGFAEPIAREAALKIKEITYIHAEGYGGGALKHGPFALLDKDIPVIHIILDDVHQELMRIAAAETKTRGARNIIITDKRSLAMNIAEPEDVIVVQSNGPLTALLTVIPLQLIAYELSVLRGLDCDRPRHLAKAVTVD